MDLGLIGTVCAACWLAHRCNSLNSDMVHQSGSAAVLRAFAVGLAAVACLLSIATMVIVAISLTGSILGPATASFYVDGCKLALTLVILVEATILAYRSRSNGEFKSAIRASSGPELAARS